MFNRFRGENKNHSFINVNEAKNQVQIPPINDERKYMNKIKKSYIEEIFKNGVTNIPNFCQSMKVYGMNRDQISEFLKLLLFYLNITINNRFISKSNSSEKNMLFTWIHIKYSINIVGFLCKFISEKKINPKNNIDLVNEINSKIDQIKRTDDNNLSNKQIEKQEIKQEFKKEIKPESSEEQPQIDSKLLIGDSIFNNFLPDLDNDNINDYDDLDNRDYSDYNDQFPDYY